MVELDKCSQFEKLKFKFFFVLVATILWIFKIINVELINN